METAFRHILVPVDFTKKNETAVTVAAELARHNVARMSLLHVIEFIDFPDDEEIASFYEKLQARSESELNRLLKSLPDDLNVSADTTINNRSKGIAMYAADNDVDLIVMSSHPIDPERRGEGWGTISYQVSALCHCSIMLLKEPKKQ